jgi:SAM-dependent methyltransferase
MIRKRRVLFNALTFIPGVAALPPVKRILQRRVTGTGGTDSARYCYSVWLRHLVLAAESGKNTGPKSVAELGPGDSIGVGLAALLSGAERYFALDVVAHANPERNLKIFDELVALFHARADIPDNEELPDVSPKLNGYRFPCGILTEDRLTQALASERVASIRGSIEDSASNESVIQYRAPWFDGQVIERDSIDMIFSQAVLEHVDELVATYRAMRLWLAPGGFMSHTIDLKSHGWAKEWNGHWTYSDFMWKLVRGKDVWMINREPASRHIKILLEEGFRVVCQDRTTLPSKVTRRQLATKFRDMPEDDLTTSGVFIHAIKA